MRLKHVVLFGIASCVAAATAPTPIDDVGALQRRIDQLEKRVDDLIVIIERQAAEITQLREELSDRAKSGRKVDFEAADQRKAPSAPTDAGEALAVGSIWSGNWWNNGFPGEKTIVMTVVARAGMECEVSFPTWDGKGTVLMTVLLDNDELTLSRVRRPDSSVPYPYNISGAGRIDGQELQFAFTFDIPNYAGPPVGGRMKLRLRKGCE
ncbi:MAG: hypothetical protein SF069_10275 [Phycisphaerae bacterium]|nr:hypothetical protein [Phycisphaerae bacterium]